MLDTNIFTSFQVVIGVNARPSAIYREKGCSHGIDILL